MPTQTQISEASTTISSVARAQIITLIRSHPRYVDSPGLFPNLASKVDAATTIQAQQMNAALALLDEIEDGTVELSGGEDAVNYSQLEDRNQLISYMIDVLYEMPLRRASVGVAQMNKVNQNAWCANCGCRRFNCPCP